QQDEAAWKQEPARQAESGDVLECRPEPTRFAARPFDGACIKERHGHYRASDQSRGNHNNSRRSREPGGSRWPDQRARANRNIFRNIARNAPQSRPRGRALPDRPCILAITARIRRAHGVLTVSNTTIETGLPLLMS